RPPRPRVFSSIKRKKSRRVAAENLLAIILGYVERGDAVEHAAEASDLMRIVAAGQDVIGAGEIDRQLQRADVEVHRVVVELAQVLARRTVDVRAALFECVKAAVEPLDEVRNRAAEVAERPLDVWEALDDAAEDEARGRECR